MTACKITVLKRTYQREYVVQYLKEGLHETFGLCDRFEEGQMYISNDLLSPPPGFCPWAWNDLRQSISALVSIDDEDNVFKDPNKVIACCTDGLRPVIFRIEKIEEY